jgi:hypothetical protein
VSVLLRQAGGFEGFGVIEEPLLPDDPAPVDSVDARRVEHGVNAAGPTVNLPVDTGDDLLAYFEQFRQCHGVAQDRGQPRAR